jgi:serine protease inhibitor
MIKSPLSKTTVALGSRLLARLTDAEPGKNVFISPTSIALALAMVQNGAAGTTAAAVAHILGISDVSLEELNAASEQLLAELGKLDLETAEEAKWGRKVHPDEYRVMMHVANGLWTQQDVPVEPAFSERLEAFYKAKAAAVDLRDPAEIAKINEWVSECTMGRIPQIVTPFTDQPGAVLLNVVYFRGGWRSKFEANNTQEGLFHLPDGSSKPVPFMQQEAHRPYYENEQMQVVELPFIGTRERTPTSVCALVVLPKPGHTLNAVLSTLTAEWWGRLEQNLFQGHNVEVNLHLPRFTVEYDINLNTALADMGMAVAFTNQADFRGMTSQSTRIDSVQHKTYLLVNEEGCEAAGATAVKMYSFGIHEPAIEMRVDRPFLFAIVTHPGPAVLFVGAINDPVAV